jgi:hypothetical protein
MKIFYILLLIITSCSNNENDILTTKTSQHSGRLSSFEVIETKIDYCEYIIINKVSGVDIIHKSNCSNNFHGNK